FLQLFEPYESLLRLGLTSLDSMEGRFARGLDPAEYAASPASVKEKSAAEISTDEQKVLDAIPVVGLFEIHCSEIRKVLARSSEEEMLLNRFRDSAQEVAVDMFQGIFAQLRKASAPKNIEQSTELREFMSSQLTSGVPGEDDAYQRWRVFGCPKQTFDLMGQVEHELVKAEKGYLKEMQQEQSDFDENLVDLAGHYRAGIVDTFAQYSNLANIKVNFCINGERPDELRVPENSCDKARVLGKTGSPVTYNMLVIEVEKTGTFEDASTLATISTTWLSSVSTTASSMAWLRLGVDSVNDRLREASSQAKLFNSREVSWKFPKLAIVLHLQYRVYVWVHMVNPCIAAYFRIVITTMVTINTTATTETALFGQESSDYTHLQQLQKEWEPFSQLWALGLAEVTAYHWLEDSEKWMQNGPFHEIDAKSQNLATDTVSSLSQQVKGLEKREDAGKVLQIARDIKAWDLSSEVIPRLVLNSFQMRISDIGDRSGKELSIEPYRTTETYILKGADEVIALIDEQIVVTQATDRDVLKAMQFSPFNKPFKDEIAWAEKLLYMSECLDGWLKAWMYLQPIFDSPDIMKQLPTEGKKFRLVDSKWRQTMARLHQNSAALQEGLLEMWNNANADLDMVQKGLDDYLETKRGAFARFYFLSNARIPDELLEILSQTKDLSQRAPSNAMAHYELRIVLPGSSPVQEMLDALRAEPGREKLLPRGPAHVTLGEFWCDDTDATTKIAQLRALCANCGPMSLRISGCSRYWRRRTTAYYLPAELVSSDSHFLTTLRKSGLLDKCTETLHVSMGRQQEPPKLQDTEERCDFITLLKLDGKRTRNFLEAVDIPLDHGGDVLP
ncbi:Dnah1, partial [Symbiodinium microadriaticum]